MVKIVCTVVREKRRKAAMTEIIAHGFLK